MAGLPLQPQLLLPFMANRVGGAHTCYLSFLAHGSAALVLITFLKLLSASTPKASFLLSSLSLHLDLLLYLVFLSTAYLCLAPALWLRLHCLHCWSSSEFCLMFLVLSPLHTAQVI